MPSSPSVQQRGHDPRHPACPVHSGAIGCCSLGPCVGPASRFGWPYAGQFTAERVKTRMAAAVMSIAQADQDQQAEGGVGGGAGHSPDVVQGRRRCGRARRSASSARTWVVGRARATQASHAGSAVIGNSDPAMNQGRIATTGVSPSYSSWVGIRLARISARPYMNTVNASTAPMNQATPLAVAWKVAAAQPSGGHQRADLQQADADGHGHVAEYDQGAGDGRGEQLAARAAGPVDDDADAGEGCKSAG